MTKKPKNRRDTLKIPKIIIVTAKLISLFSTKLLVRFVSKLFTTPIKHKLPKRELQMDQLSTQNMMLVPALQKEVVVYTLGEGSPSILLVHGWSGRGTQLVKFAEALVNAGYKVISFDAPSHGKSPGNQSLLPEFIESILAVDKQYGPFEAAIGHSLGGMSLLNAANLGFHVNRMVIIGSGDIIKDIFDDFIARLELNPEISDKMREHFEHKHTKSMASYSAYLSARSVDIPVLVIHDQNDHEVPVKCAHHIFENLKKGELLITSKLGHRKILGDPAVIKAALEFINVKFKNYELSDTKI